jgi:hypothetical protein
MLKRRVHNQSGLVQFLNSSHPHSLTLAIGCKTSCSLCHQQNVFCLLKGHYEERYCVCIHCLEKFSYSFSSSSASKEFYLDEIANRLDKIKHKKILLEQEEKLLHECKELLEQQNMKASEVVEKVQMQVPYCRNRLTIGTEIVFAEMYFCSHCDCCNQLSDLVLEIASLSKLCMKCLFLLK